MCKKHENTGKDNCPAKPIKEDALEKAFVRALNRLVGDREQILDALEEATVGEISDTCGDAMVEIEEDIARLQGEIMKALREKGQGKITEKEYLTISGKIGSEIDKLLMRKEEILSEQGRVQLATYRVEEVKQLLSTGKILEEFDRVIFKSLVRMIKIISNKEIEIEFECGITVRETL